MKQHAKNYKIAFFKIIKSPPCMYCLLFSVGNIIRYTGGKNAHDLLALCIGFIGPMHFIPSGVLHRETLYLKK